MHVRVSPNDTPREFEFKGGPCSRCCGFLLHFVAAALAQVTTNETVRYEGEGIGDRVQAENCRTVFNAFTPTTPAVKPPRVNR